MWTTGAGVTCSPSRFKTPGFIHNTPYPHPHPNHLHNQLKHHTTDLSSVVEHLPDMGQGPMYLIPSTNTPQHTHTFIFIFSLSAKKYLGFVCNLEFLYRPTKIFRPINPLFQDITSSVVSGYN